MGNKRGIKMTATLLDCVGKEEKSTEKCQKTYKEAKKEVDGKSC